MPLKNVDVFILAVFDLVRLQFVSCGLWFQCQFSFQSFVRQLVGERIVFQQIVTMKLDIHLQKKKEYRHRTYIFHKIIIDLNAKCKTMKF